jgi:hypothetical protein
VLVFYAPEKHIEIMPYLKFGKKVTKRRLFSAAFSDSQPGKETAMPPSSILCFLTAPRLSYLLASLF